MKVNLQLLVTMASQWVMAQDETSDFIPEFSLNFIFSSVRRGLDLGTGGWRFKSHTKSCQSTTWALPMCPRARHWTSNCLDHRIGWSDKHGLKRGSQTWMLKWITFVYEVSYVIRKKKNNDPVFLFHYRWILFYLSMRCRSNLSVQLKCFITSQNLSWELIFFGQTGQDSGTTARNSGLSWIFQDVWLP